MSAHAFCPPCESGHHDKHDRDWGIRPGLLGGVSCHCQGDPGCTERANETARRFAAVFGSVALPEEPQPTEKTQQ